MGPPRIMDNHHAIVTRSQSKQIPLVDMTTIDIDSPTKNSLTADVKIDSQSSKEKNKPGLRVRKRKKRLNVDDKSFQCPICTLEVSDLKKHMHGEHKMKRQEGKFEESKQARVRLCQSYHKGEHCILPCDECCIWLCDNVFKKHMKKIHKRKAEELKDKIWNRKTMKSKLLDTFGNVVKSPITLTTETGDTTPTPLMMIKFDNRIASSERVELNNVSTVSNRFERYRFFSDGSIPFVDIHPNSTSFNKFGNGKAANTLESSSKTDVSSDHNANIVTTSKVIDIKMHDDTKYVEDIGQSATIKQVETRIMGSSCNTEIDTNISQESRAVKSIKSQSPPSSGLLQKPRQTSTSTSRKRKRKRLHNNSVNKTNLPKKKKVPELNSKVLDDCSSKTILSGFVEDVHNVATMTKLFIQKAPDLEGRLSSICREVLLDLSKPIKWL